MRLPEDTFVGVAKRLLREERIIAALRDEPDPELLFGMADLDDDYAGELLLEADGLVPNHPSCDNCGHVHLPGGYPWVRVAPGSCCPEDRLPSVLVEE